MDREVVGAVPIPFVGFTRTPISPRSIRAPEGELTHPALDHAPTSQIAQNFGSVSPAFCSS